MSNGILGGSKFKQMGVGGGGENPRKQLILAIVLGVIVFSMVAMVLYRTIGKGGGKGPKGDLPLQCVECGKFFEVDLRDLNSETEDRDAPTTVDCPECGAENAGMLAKLCEKCGKPFTRNSEKYKYEYWKEMGHWPMMLSPNELDQLEDDICPHCGVNVSEMIRDN